MQHDEDALELEPRLDAASLARRHVRTRLLAWDLAELLEPVLLLTSEIVTNALLHSGTPLTVLLERDGAGVRVGVRDGSRVPPVQRRHSPTASTGRGVQLLGSIADDWGWEPDGQGKLVWFQVLSRAGWAPALDLEDLSEVDL